MRALLLAAAYSVISHGVPHGDRAEIELPHGLTLLPPQSPRTTQPPRARCSAPVPHRVMACVRSVVVADEMAFYMHRAL